MKETYFVPFETAKLLKEKGYNEQNDYVYADLGAGIGLNYADFELYVFKNRNSDIMVEDSEICTAPTYHEVIDWLERKGYPVEVMWVREHSDLVWFCIVSHTTTKNYLIREEALNAGILKALGML